MSSPAIIVVIDVGPTDRFLALVREGLDGNAPGPFHDMKTRWAALYSGFAKRRFDVFSRGGGDWAPLALTTLRRKLLKGVKKGRGASRKGALRGQGEGKGQTSSLARDTQRGGALVGFSGRTTSILIDRGLLRNALGIGYLGNLFETIPGGIVFGFSDAPHPPSGKKSKAATIGQIAAWHNFGVPPNLPKRAILARPDTQTTRGLQAALTTAIARAGQAAGGAAQ